MQELRITHKEEMAEVVARVLEAAAKLPPQKATVIALSGDLGAGKTTFVQELARTLGVAETVVSPTFVVMKQYTCGEGEGAKKATPFSHLVHIDAYRIEDVDEMRVLRFSEVLAIPHTLVCIEWPERIATLIPPDAVRVGLVIDGTKRLVTIT